MKKIILSLILIAISFLASSQSFPRYLIENGDTIGVIISIEQAQSLDNDSELLLLFKKLRIDCDKLDAYYLQVINGLDQKMALLEIKSRDLIDQGIEKDNLVKNLNTQIKNYELDKKLCDKQISIKDQQVKTLKKEISRQKFRKFISIGGNIILGIVTTILIIKS